MRMELNERICVKKKKKIKIQLNLSLIGARNERKLAPIQVQFGVGFQPAF